MIHRDRFNLNSEISYVFREGPSDTIFNELGSIIAAQDEAAENTV
jgi:hypothetical protein